MGPFLKSLVAPWAAPHPYASIQKSFQKSLVAGSTAAINSGRMGSVGIKNKVLNTVIFDCPAFHHPLLLLLSGLCLWRIVPEKWKAKQDYSPLSRTGLQMPLAVKGLGIVLAESLCIWPNWVFILSWSVSGLGCKFCFAHRGACACVLSSPMIPVLYAETGWRCYQYLSVYH